MLHALLFGVFHVQVQYYLLQSFGFTNYSPQSSPYSYTEISHILVDLKLIQMLHQIWTSAKSTQEQAQKLADYFNSQLVKENHVQIVFVTDGWYMIVGTKYAHTRCEQMQKEFKEAVEKKKEQPANQVEIPE